MRHFSSDFHIWHTNVVVKYGRGHFGTIENMNESLIKNWNERVKPEDTAYMLGDFALAWQPVGRYTRRLNGNKELVAGNHDYCHPACKQARKKNPDRQYWINRYKDLGWSNVFLVGDITLKNGMRFKMCHLPYVTGDSHDVKHFEHRIDDQGIPLLCGHVHTAWKHRYTPKGTLMINVGVDQWNYAPVSEDELCEYIKTLGGPK